MKPDQVDIVAPFRVSRLLADQSDPERRTE
jgi:hypothetical protein